MRSAVRAGADVLVTGDVKYHDAREAQDLGIALIDAGHFSTEIIMVEAVTGRLVQMLAAGGFDGCEVVPCRVESDPFNCLQVP
jgi:putative NIF3 family GTP cyclohydrolase 1 type 2